MRTRPSTRPRARLGAVLAAAALLSLTACSAGDDDAAAEAGAPAEQYEEQYADEEVEAGTTSSLRSSDGDAAAGTAPAGSGGDDAAGGDDTAGGGVALTAGAVPLGRQVVQTAEVELRADDPRAAADAVVAAATRAGGFVAATDLSTSDDGVVSGSVTVRVPADRLSVTLEAIASAGDELISQRLSTEDVTGEVSDIEAQLRNLRALETELVALLADVRERSRSTDDVLVVFERIRQVRGEIEVLQGRRATLGDLVALSTVTVYVAPTEAALPVRPGGEPTWAPGRVLAEAWASTVVFLQGVGELAIRFVVTGLPVLLVLGAPVVGAWLLWRRRRQARVASIPPPPAA